METTSAAMEAAPPSFRDYIDVIIRRWWIVAGAAVGGLIIAGLLSVTSSPVYEASTRLMIAPSGESFVIADFTGLTQTTFVDTLAAIIQSRAVADLALKYLSPAEREPGAPPPRLPGAPNRTRAELLRGLKVQRVRGTDLITISAQARTPERAAQGASAVARGFIDWNLQTKRSQASAGAQFIETQLAKIGKDLREAEDTLTAFRIAGGQISLSQQTADAVGRIAGFEASRREAAAEQQVTEASLRRIRAELARQSPQIPSDLTLVENPVLNQLRLQLAQLEVQLVGLREQFTDRHPQVVAVKSQIGAIQARLREQARWISEQAFVANPLRAGLMSQVITLEVQRSALAAREHALARIVDRYLRDAKSLPPKEVELARLTRDVAVAEQTYVLLLQKLQEARISEASIVGDVRIVDAATPPGAPISPRPRFDALLGLVLGLVVGVGASYGLEMLDTTFKSPEEVERQLGLSVLAVIPRWRGSTKDERMPLMMDEHRRSPFAETFRHLRTSILYSSPDRPLRTIEVTSPGPAEGKSTIAANLAAALAQIGKRVWLVECDLRKPSLAWTFQPATHLGLTDLLVDGLPVDDAVHRTFVENLWLIPSGTKPPNPAELLGSQKMRTLLASGTDGADAIILDAPPVLPVTDATVLAPHVDGVILVIHMMKTPREAARRAVQHLAAVGARVLGVVVNGMPERSRGYSYYYSYSYSGYYGSAGKDKDVTAVAPTAAPPKT